MKLFKKLAAAVLAAALALTMVGCGGNSYATQNELLKITIDQIGETVTHTKKADEMAAALLAAADTAAEQMENKGVDAKELLQNPAVIKAAKIDLEKTPCMFNPIDVDSQIKSSGVMGEFLKMEWMANAAGLYRFVDPGTLPLRAVVCLSAYRKLTGLYNMTVLATSVNQPTQGVLGRLDVQGIAFDNGMKLASHYLKAFRWEAAP